MEQIVLAAEHLKKNVRARGREWAAVDDVSFQLRRGECLGIVGESGSGKSTVARLLTRLIEPTQGRILLLGREITAAQGRELMEVYQQIQMVFQLPAESFDPRRTLGDGIGESLRNRGMDRRAVRSRVEALMQRCGLEPELAGRYPHQVSGGQCQRAAIARALAIGPSVLICDEATSALDVTVQKQVLRLLIELRAQEGLSLLLISHDLALVQAYCDRVLVMHVGRIVESGAPDEIIRSPKAEYTRRLIESAL